MKEATIKNRKDGTLKKVIIDMEKNGLPFKLITRFDINEQIVDVMEKPVFSDIPQGLHLSGAHQFPDGTQNHFDHWSGGKVWADRSETDPTRYPYTFSGNSVVI